MRCAEAEAGAADERLAVRVSIDVRDAPLESVSAHVAEAAKLDGVDWRATARPVVTMTMTNVRASTALAALSETSGVRLRTQNGRLVVEDR